jgi:hypothetical protein
METCSSKTMHAASLIGVTAREYRELEAGDAFPDVETWKRICELYGWTQTFLSPGEKTREQANDEGV